MTRHESVSSGVKCAVLLAWMTATIGLAQSRPTISQLRVAEGSSGYFEAALPSAGETTAQKGEPQSTDPWTDQQLVNPEELAKQVSSNEKPVVLHIGVALLFRGGHIPGSKYVGQASRPEGIEGLKKAVEGLQRTQKIVLYCGCCPWKDCPNIRPAFSALKAMRFTRVQVLFLPDSFPRDWTEKGLPIEKG